MTWTLVSLTARQLLGRRRTAFIALVLALPVLIAIIYRANREVGDDATEFALALVEGLIATLLLPLVALVLGTAALGAEVEDGTAVFLLTKPVSRRRVLTVKMAVAAATTMALVVPATVATAWIATGSATADGVTPGLGLGAAAASLLYCAVFVALSAVTTRALVIGLVYVFVWEAIVTNWFSGLRWISIREYGAGWSDLLVTVDDAALFDPRLGPTAAVIASAVVLVLAIVQGTRALADFEVGERA